MVAVTEEAMAVDGMPVMAVDTVAMRLDHGQVMVVDTVAAGAQVVAAAVGAIMVVARWAAVAEDGVGEADRHPTKTPFPLYNIHTSHKNQALSYLTKPRCYEKIETYSNYLNQFIYLYTMYSS